MTILDPHPHLEMFGYVSHTVWWWYRNKTEYKRQKHLYNPRVAPLPWRSPFYMCESTHSFIHSFVLNDTWQNSQECKEIDPAVNSTLLH